MVNYDVIVVGGGSAGIAAAIAASRMDKKVLLIERNSFFGGAATQRLVTTYCGFFDQEKDPQQVVGGIGNEVLEGLKDKGFYQHYRRSPTGTVVVDIDPEVVKLQLDEMAQDAKIDYLLHTTVINTVVDDGKITAIDCYNDSGNFRVHAKSFIDASGDANLAFQAGARYRLGDGHGTMQPGDMMIRFGGLPQNINLTPDSMAKAVRQAKEAGIKGLTKEVGISYRALKPKTDFYIILADEVMNDFTPEEMTRVEIDGRRQAWAYLQALQKFLPGAKHIYLVETAPKFGIRESRHILGDYELTGADVLNGRKFTDSIGRGAWFVEYRPGLGLPNKTRTIKDLKYYEIPLRSLHSVSIKNLWMAGRTISADEMAFSSARVMGTSFVTGQAAGVAAVMDGATTSDIQQQLKKQDVLI